MDNGHWIMMGLTAALLAALWALSAASSPKTRLFRWSQRIFWTFSLLWASGSLGGIGLNVTAFLTADVLGLPGYAALWILDRM